MFNALESAAKVFGHETKLEDLPQEDGSTVKGLRINAYGLELLAIASENYFLLESVVSIEPQNVAILNRCQGGLDEFLNRLFVELLAGRTYVYIRKPQNGWISISLVQRIVSSPKETLSVQRYIDAIQELIAGTMYAREIIRQALNEVIPMYLPIPKRDDVMFR
jgi:hypothetical protein